MRRARCRRGHHRCSAAAGGCAKISAPSVDFAGPTAELRRQGDRGQRALQPLHGRSQRQLGLGAARRTCSPGDHCRGRRHQRRHHHRRLSAAPTFSVGDIVSVTWSGNAKPPWSAPPTSLPRRRPVPHPNRLAGRADPVGRPRTGRLRQGMRRAAAQCAERRERDPRQLRGRGHPRPRCTSRPGNPGPTAAATATIGAFACPLPTGPTAAGPAQPPRCDGTDGVTATATLGGVSIHGCGNTGQSCCGVNGHTCAGPPPPPSLCP